MDSFSFLFLVLFFPVLLLTLTLLRLDVGAAGDSLGNAVKKALVTGAIGAVIFYIIYPPYSYQDTTSHLLRGAISVLLGPTIVSIAMYVAFWRSLRRDESAPHRLKLRPTGVLCLLVLVPVGAVRIWYSHLGSVLSKQQLSAEEIDALSEQFIVRESQSLASSLVIRQKNVSPVALSQISKSRTWLVRDLVASNPRTPPEDLARLSKDSEPSIRARVSGNPSTPPEVLAAMIGDRAAHGLISNRAIDGPLVDQVIGSLSPRTVAESRSTAPNFLRALAKDPDLYVRSLVLMNNNTPCDVVEALVVDVGEPPWLDRDQIDRRARRCREQSK